MNHTAELKALKARVAELEALVDNKADRPAPKIEKAPVYPDGLKRCPHTGELVKSAAPVPQSYSERMAAQRMRQENQFEAERQRQTEGLPPGYYRDPCGMVRDKSGRIADPNRKLPEASMEQDNGD